MIVVSHSAPLMNIAVVGQVHLRERFYGQVHIPEAVWQELSAIGTGQPWAAVIPTLSWLETRSVSHRGLWWIRFCWSEIGEKQKRSPWRWR